jgi:hypothetical protein
MTRTATVLLLSVASVAVADAPLGPPELTSIWSSNRRIVAVSDPAQNRLTVYRAVGGERTELWSMAGWERSFAVSDDGEYLVACFSGLNLLPLDFRQNWKLLKFYRRGVTLRSWTVAELVRDQTKLLRTASHYEWGHCAGFESTGAFAVVTVDRGTIVFDVSTGQLVSERGRRTRR